MLRVVSVFYLLLVIPPITLNYPLCSNWCYGQRQPVIYGNNWGNICRPNNYVQYCNTGNGRCCNNNNYPAQGGIYPVPQIDPALMNPVVAVHPGIPEQQQPIFIIQSGQPPLPVPPLVPAPPLPVPAPPPLIPAPPPISAPNINPAGSAPREWLCPSDPQPRVASSGSLNENDELIECNYDDNCPNYPLRNKCCYDNGIGRKVCKPAILV